MKIILITPPTAVPQETETIEELFGEGLDILHLRKPDWSSDEIEDYITALPEKYMAKTTVHGFPQIAKKHNISGIHLNARDPVDMLIGWQGKKSRSTHGVEEIESQQGSFDYFFLSPVFDSISKKGYTGAFEKSDLQQFLSKPRSCEVMALGGIDDQNVAEVSALGFDGAVLLGYIWQHDEITKRIGAFRKLVNKCKSIVNTF